VLVNSVCPGWVATDMGGRRGRLVIDGARSVVWAATLNDNGPTGGFYRDGPNALAKVMRLRAVGTDSDCEPETRTLAKAPPTRFQRAPTSASF